MATTSKETRPVTAGQATANNKDAARVADEARRAAAVEVPERQPGDDLDAEDSAQFDG